MRLLFVALALVVTAASAHAEKRVKVRPGDTLGAIAQRFDCSVAAVKRVNRLRGSRIQAGRTLTVPACGKRKAPRPAPRAAAVDSARGQSVGRPWRGRLRGAVHLPEGKGYLIRRPERAWGTPELVALVREVLTTVRADHPKAHTLAIGDLSARHGGKITEHSSHQSGRDVDVGLFFRTRPAGYPHSFVVGAADTLDLAATWDLLVAFARTADRRGGVAAIYLDYQLQGALYEWAKARDVDRAYLDRLFQYPDGKRASGLVRHEPHHDDHLHVRIQCPPGDAACL